MLKKDSYGFDPQIITIDNHNGHRRCLGATTGTATSLVIEDPTLAVHHDDATGQTVLRGGGETHDVIVDTTDVAPGTYFLIVDSFNGLADAFTLEVVCQ